MSSFSQELLHQDEHHTSRIWSKIEREGRRRSHLAWGMGGGFSSAVICFVALVFLNRYFSILANNKASDAYFPDQNLLFIFWTLFALAIGFAVVGAVCCYKRLRR